MHQGVTIPIRPAPADRGDVVQLVHPPPAHARTLAAAETNVVQGPGLPQVFTTDSTSLAIPVIDLGAS